MKQKYKKWLIRGVAALGGVLVLAVIITSSGIIPVKASSGHWAITNFILHYTMHRSVSTYSLGVGEVPLDEPWLVLKGAGHFETGCRPCHGAPDLEPPVIPAAMTPHPPKLSPRVSEWPKDELFYVIKHGIKFTAMPAWPAQQRDDEVRALVAFVLQLPELDAKSYRELVEGDTGTARAAAAVSELEPTDEAALGLAASCARCHGARGEGRGSAAFPKLARQKVEYQVAALAAYADGRRYSGIMQPIAANLSPEEMRTLSNYYASMRDEARNPEAVSAPAELLEHGREIAEEGLPAQGVPACVECHGPAPGRRNAHYPTLAGQYADYLMLQLKLFKQRDRGGSAYAHLMHHVVDRLDEDAMRDVSLYYASLREDGATPEQFHGRREDQPTSEP